MGKLREWFTRPEWSWLEVIGLIVIYFILDTVEPTFVNYALCFLGFMVIVIINKVLRR